MNPIFLIIMLNLIQNSVSMSNFSSFSNFTYHEHSFLRQYTGFNSSYEPTFQKAMDTKIRCSSLCQQTSDPMCVGYCYKEGVGECYFYHEAIAAPVLNLSIIQSPMNQYTEARNYCEINGGILALPTNATENQLLASILTSAGINSVWLRVRQDDSAGDWHDDEKNGPVIEYANWNTTQNLNGTGGCAQLSADEKWSEVDCQSANLHFMCNEPPATLSTPAPPFEPEVRIGEGQKCYNMLV